MLKWFARSSLNDRLKRAERYGADELSNARLHEAVEPILLKLDHLRGFEKVNDLTWVRPGENAIHALFGLVRMKGGVAWPAFGLSVDFVPTVERGRAVLRAAPRRAKFDIVIQVSDHSIDYMFGPAPAAEDAANLLPKLLDRAATFWAEHQTLASLADAVATMEAHLEGRPGLGYMNYVQPALARPFLLAASGEKDSARRYLAEQQARVDATAWPSFETIFAQTCALADETTATIEGESR